MPTERPILDCARADDLLDLLGGLVFCLDPETHRVSYVNARVRDLFGASVEEWVSAPRPFDERLHPDEHGSVLSALSDVVKTGSTRHLAARMQVAPGQYRWFRTTFRPVREEGGEVRRVVGLLLDITERVATEVLLREVEHDPRLSLLIAQIPAILWTVDRELCFTSGLGAGLSALGLSPDAVVPGLSLYEYFQTDDPHRIEITSHRKALAGERVRYESAWAGHTFECHIEPFRDAARQIVGVIGVALDVTERRTAEEHRDRLLLAEREAREVAENAVRVRDEFLSIASHELRTPITSLKLAIQILSQPGPEKVRVPAEVLLASAERQVRQLTRLVDQLLDVSRIQSGRLALEPQPVELGSVVEQVICRMRPELERAQIRLSEDIDRVHGVWDASRLDQLITNMLSNALRYAAGTRVEIRVGPSSAKTARLVVRDHGIGIAPDRLAHIFDRFERAVSSREYGGLGLGLFIARDIVRSHGGEIGVESELGRGTTFTVELPLEPPPDAESLRGGSRADRGERGCLDRR